MSIPHLPHLRNKPFRLLMHFPACDEQNIVKNEASYSPFMSKTPLSLCLISRIWRCFRAHCGI